MIPWGLTTNYYIRKFARMPFVYTVAAWGNGGDLMGRDKEVVEMLGDLYCFGLTKLGHPKHPLYLPKDTGLVPFTSQKDNNGQ